MKKLYFLMIFSLIATGLAHAVNYVVSGAGTPEVNGTYVESTAIENNRHVYYSNGITNKIYYDGYNWVISNDGGFGYDTYYANQSTAKTPPFTGWTRNAGASPIPTVGIEGPAVLYSSTIFEESTNNDGSISTEFTITSNNNNSLVFTGNIGDDLVSLNKIIVSNMPSGLRASIIKTSNTVLTVSIKGSAFDNNNVNDIQNLTFAFQNAAFSTNDASSVVFSSRNDLEINFLEQVIVNQDGTGNFTTIKSAVAAVNNGDIILIKPGTYTESNIQFMNNAKIIGSGAGNTIIQAASTPFTFGSNFHIFYSTLASSLEFKDLTIQNGKATDGPALWIIDCEHVLVENVSFLNNQATSASYGGIITPSRCNFEIKNCTFSGNVSAFSTIDGQQSTTNLSIINSTFFNNNGGKSMIKVDLDGRLNISGSTIANSTASEATLNFNLGNLTIENTIVSGSSVYDFKSTASTVLTDIGHNIIESQNGTTLFNSSTDILYSHDYLGNVQGASGLGWNKNALAQSGALNLATQIADNSSIYGTQTLALTSPSFAMNNGAGSASDQRGAPAYGNKDIGAYEYNPNWNVWTGTTSDNWAVGTNWSLNRVPGSSDHIGILGTVNVPSNTNLIQVSNITIAAKSSLTLQPNTLMIVSGAIINKSGSSGLILNAGQLGFPGFLSLAATDFELSYKAYVNANQWYLLTSPLTDQSISGFLRNTENSIIPTKTDSRGMMDFNPQTNSWNSYFTNGTNANLINGKGYGLRTSTAGNISFRGYAGNGASKTVSGLTSGNWNLIGNPFTYPIGITDDAGTEVSFLTYNLTTLGNLNSGYGIYFWDGLSNTYKAISNAASQGYSIVQIGQGFFVKMASGKSSVDFNNTMVAIATTVPLKSPPYENSWSRIQLQVTDSTASNSTTIAFHDKMTNEMDPGYDARIFKGNSGLEIFTKLTHDNDMELAIQALPKNDLSDLIIPVGIESSSDGLVTISAQTENLPADCKLILEDSELNTFTNLATENYSVFLTADTTAGIRFYLHTSERIPTNSIEESILKLKVNATIDQILLQGKVSERSRASLYSLKGEKIEEFELHEGSLNCLNSPIPSGIYILEVNTPDSTERLKLVKP